MAKSIWTVNFLLRLALSKQHTNVSSTAASIENNFGIVCITCCVRCPAHTDKVVPGLVAPPAFMMVQDPMLRYSEILERANRTTMVGFTLPVRYNQIIICHPVRTLFPVVNSI